MIIKLLLPLLTSRGMNAWRRHAHLPQQGLQASHCSAGHCSTHSAPSRLTQRPLACTFQPLLKLFLLYSMSHSSLSPLTWLTQPAATSSNTRPPWALESEDGQRPLSWSTAASLAKQRLAKAFKKFPWSETGGPFRLPSPQPGKSSRSCNPSAPQPTLKPCQKPSRDKKAWCKNSLTSLYFATSLITLNFSFPLITYARGAKATVCNETRDVIYYSTNCYAVEDLTWGESKHLRNDMIINGWSSIEPGDCHGVPTRSHFSLRDESDASLLKLAIFPKQGDIYWEGSGNLGDSLAFLPKHGRRHYITMRSAGGTFICKDDHKDGSWNKCIGNYDLRHGLHLPYHFNAPDCSIRLYPNGISHNTCQHSIQYSPK